MPARVAHSTSSDSRRSSDNETETLTDVEKNSNVNVELTARRVANSTSEAVRTLANRTEITGLSKRTTKTTNVISLQDPQTTSTDQDSLTIVRENVPPNDIAGLQKVIITAERVAASTSGAVLKLGSSFQHQ